MVETLLMAKKRNTACVARKHELSKRPLLSEGQARPLESIFKTMANTTRLRMVHALVQSGELCVGELAEKLGMTPQAVSNQLQRLSHSSIVESRREGLQVYYNIVDPCVVSLLELCWCLAEETGKSMSAKGKSRKVAS